MLTLQYYLVCFIIPSQKCRIRSYAYLNANILIEATGRCTHGSVWKLKSMQAKPQYSLECSCFWFTLITIWRWLMMGKSTIATRRQYLNHQLRNVGILKSVLFFKYSQVWHVPLKMGFLLVVVIRNILIRPFIRQQIQTDAPSLQYKLKAIFQSVTRIQKFDHFCPTFSSLQMCGLGGVKPKTSLKRMLFSNPCLFSTKTKLMWVLPFPVHNPVNQVRLYLSKIPTLIPTFTKQKVRIYVGIKVEIIGGNFR